MRARVLTFVTALILSASVLAGCANTSPEISSSASTQMQTVVVSIAESAAAGDAVSALAQLDQLQQLLNAALADGSVTAERGASIQTRIDLVRADLQPEPVVEPTPEPTAAPTTGTDDGDDDADNGNSGPGNNNGNGNDKGKDKGDD